MARILLVDDDDLVRQSLAMRLEAAGHDVTGASHGGDGLRAFAANPFDLVITDIFMPEVEGIEFLRALRKEHPHLPIIVITGGSQRAVAGADGIDHYLQVSRHFGSTKTLAKPFSPALLIALVDECLARPPHA